MSVNIAVGSKRKVGAISKCHITSINSRKVRFDAKRGVLVLLKKKDSAAEPASMEQIAVTEPALTAAAVVSTDVAVPEKKKRSSILDSYGFGKCKGVASAPKQAPVFATVVVGKSSKYVKKTGVALTVTRELTQCPKSVLARERVVATNTGKKKEGKPKKQVSDESAKELVRLRVKENELAAAANKSVVVLRAINGGKELRCDVCHRTLKAKKSNVDEHMQSAKHKNAMVTQLKNIIEDSASRDFIKEYFERTHAKGETIDMDTLKFRFETTENFLATGIAINKIDALRPYLEKHSGHALTTSSHLRELIPPLLEKEIDTIMKECKNNEIVVIFDGTTKVDEVFAIIFRWVTLDLKIVERLVEMGKYQHGFNHEELAGAVLKILAKYNIDFGQREHGRITRNSQVLAFQRDRCSVNSAAITILNRNLVGSKDMECLSHTIQHCGDHLAVPILLRVKQDLCALIKESYHTQVHFLTTIGFQFRHPGNTRWFGTYEVYVVIKENFDSFFLFVTTAVGDGEVDEDGVRIGRLTVTVTNAESRSWLKLEAFVSVIVMKPLVEATYILEGKGPCAIIAYDIIKKIESWFNLHQLQLSFPGVPLAMQECVQSLTIIPAFLAAHAANGQIAALVDTKVRTIISGAIDYFRSRVLGMLAKDVTIYKTVRYANPLAMMREANGFNAGDFLQEVRALQHFTAADINAMVLEIPMYRAYLQHIPQFLWEKDEMTFAQEFWDAAKQRQLPYLTKLVRYGFAMISSSGSVERVFSILKMSFGRNQLLALEDYVMLSCMLQKNRRDNA